MIKKPTPPFPSCLGCKDELSPHDDGYWRKDGLCTRCQNLQKKYKITYVEYTELCLKQNFCCAICGEKETKKPNNKKGLLVVDHCHRTGYVRGLLCSACNTGIGFLKDNKKVLAKAIKYLNHPPAFAMGFSMKHRYNKKTWHKNKKIVDEMYPLTHPGKYNSDLGHH